MDAIQLAGGEAVYVANRSDHHLDLDAIAAESAGAKMLVLCNPVNPTGAVFSGDELIELNRRLDPATYLVVDEAYAHLVYADEPFTSALALPPLRERLVYVQTLSKTYAMTGWRIGYTIAAPDVAKDIALVHRTMNSSINAAVQRAAIAALTEGDSLTAPMLAEYRRRREFVIDRVSRIDNASIVAPDARSMRSSSTAEACLRPRWLRACLPAVWPCEPGRSTAPAARGMFVCRLPPTCRRWKKV